MDISQAETQTPQHIRISREELAGTNGKPEKWWGSHHPIGDDSNVYTRSDSPSIFSSLFLKHDTKDSSLSLLLLKSIDTSDAVLVTVIIYSQFCVLHCKHGEGRVRFLSINMS